MQRAGRELRIAWWVSLVGIASVASVGFMPGLMSGCATTTATPSATPRASADSPARSVGEVHKRGTGKLIAEVGPRGGTLELSNGARLSIPAGALSEVVEITLAEGARTTAFSNHEYERAVGPIVEISPEFGLNGAATVSVPLPQLPEGFSNTDLAIGVEVVSDAQRAVQGQATQTRWDYLNASATQGRAVAELGSLPGYRVQFLVSRSN